MQMRQGDVFLEKVGGIPDGAKPVPNDQGRVILAYGEVTGHAHALQPDAAFLFEAPTGERFLRVVKETDLTHEEHAPVHLTPGLYIVRQQREYFPGEVRLVAD